MFYKIFNLYSIMTFPKEDYKKIITNMKKSYAYLGYIDPSKKVGYENKRYAKYLNLKQSMYTRKVPQVKGFYATFDPNSNKYEPKDIEFSNTQPIVEDYYYTKEFNMIDEKKYIVNHLVNPVERKLQHLALDTEEHLANIDSNYVKVEQLQKQTRFTLLPFIAKIDESFIEPTIIVTIYSEGIVTVNIMVSMEYKKINKLESRSPGSFTFDTVDFYPIKKKYTFKDYWSKKNRKENFSMHEVLDFYEGFIKNICNTTFKVNADYRPTSWVICDFDSNKRLELSQFINNNKEYYFCHLKNSPKEYLDNFSSEAITNYLSKQEVLDHKNVSFYCNEHTSILSISYKRFYDVAKNLLKESERDLKKENIYELEINKIYKNFTWEYMFEYLRIYELTFIKKFYLRKVLDDLNYNSYHSISEYNKVKSDINNIMLTYDEEIIFQSDGSPKELFIQIEDKTHTSRLLTKVESLFNNIRDDRDKQREYQIKRNESFIFTVTTLLTVILSYRGLKYITEDILGNIPFLGSFINMHPLRYTFSLWMIFVLIMLYLNYKRQSSFRK